MKVEHLKRHLDGNRPMKAVSIQFAVDVIDDLTRIAPLPGSSGDQPLVCVYDGQGLWIDLERPVNDTVTAPL
jgi:hypothetical protein